jgi:hypothetical protein
VVGCSATAAAQRRRWHSNGGSTAAEAAAAAADPAAAGGHGDGGGKAGTGGGVLEVLFLFVAWRSSFFKLAVCRIRTFNVGIRSTYVMFWLAPFVMFSFFVMFSLAP